VNTHLHSLIDDDYLRLTQVEMMLFWINQRVDFSKDVVAIVGDFNAKPNSETYLLMLKEGYTSSYQHVHGHEPQFTFPSGLQAEHMDTDPPGTFDYIFLKGKSFSIKACEVLANKHLPEDSTIYGSDHFAVAADVQLQL
jgi:endonuclease/exonuclease/phosphatase family metal-dependent hydrolase